MAEIYSSQELFLQALYDKESTSIPAFLKTYEDLLSSTGDESNILHANRLKQYRKEITDKKYLSELRKNFNALYTLIDKQYPDLHFIIDGRIKSVISMDKKITKNINEHKSLDRLRDTAAFRIMLFGNEPPEKLIDLCYHIMNNIIKHNITNYILCEEPDIETNPESNSKHDIIIPNKSKIEPKYAYGVKDYILHPKENGYQSLHSTYRKQNGGQCFEVQVRTFDMHLYAESGEANHKAYKSKKYTSLYNFDRTKVHIPGYGVNNNEVFDFVGLEKGLEILRRQKPF